jgi:flagellar biosynthesis repressor protein FlbT
MSGLVLKLAPKERLLINGAVVENGDRRSRVTVLTPNAKILRLKDAIHPEDAKTPVKYACYLSQLLLSGDLDSTVVKARLKVQIDSLSTVFRGTEGSKLLNEAAKALDASCLYSCLKCLRQLLPLESKLLGYPPK